MSHVGAEAPAPTCRAPRVLVGPDRRLLRAVPPGDGVLHRAEHAALPLTSSVAAAPFGPPFRPDRVGDPQILPSSRPRQRPRLAGTRTPSADEYPLLHTSALPTPGSCLSAPAARRLPPAGSSRLRSSPDRSEKAWDPRGSATVLGALPPRAGFERRFRLPGLPGGLDLPRSSKGELRARRFPSTSATRTAREHNHVPSDLRPASPTRRPRLAPGWERAPDGVGAPSASSTSVSR